MGLECNLSNRSAGTQIANHTMLQSSVPTSKPCASASPLLSRLLPPLPLPAPSLAHSLLATVAVNSFREPPQGLVSSWYLPFFLMTLYWWHLNARLVLNHFRIIALAVYRYLMNSFLSIYEFTIQLSGQHPKILCSETKFFLSLQEKQSAFLANKVSNVWMDRWHLLAPCSLYDGFFCSV